MKRVLHLNVGKEIEMNLMRQILDEKIAKYEKLEEAASDKNEYRMRGEALDDFNLVLKVFKEQQKICCEGFLEK